MPHLRTDPLTGRRVVIASDRAGRPNEFAKTAAPPHTVALRPDCPFCAGNEAQTPPALMQVGAGDQWRRRVVPNKYPMCAPPGSMTTAGELAGEHEVIIECREHLQATTQLGVEGLAEVFGVWAARLTHWRDDARLPFRMVFRNVGPSAGASLSHLHSQFLALPEISLQQQQEHRNVLATGDPRAAWGDWLADQVADGQRVVAQSDSFVVFCPRVPRGALEMFVMPRERSAWFEESLSGASRQQELAALLMPVMAQLEQRIAPAGYNMILHTSPTTPEHAAVGWWRLEIVPRAASLAGFELGTGVYLCTMTPENAAAELRS